jgi:hypothetical protein
MNINNLFHRSSRLLGCLHGGKRWGPSRERRMRRLRRKIKPITMSWDTPEERAEYKRVRREIKRLEAKLFPEEMVGNG